MLQTNGAHILAAENLTKSYDGKLALRGLTFSLQAGHIMGFLGPNGAGKTTAIRILTTIFEPTSGQFYVDGISSADPEKIRRKIGVLPESLGFPKGMTGVEFLSYFGQHYGHKPAAAKEKAMALLREVGLAEKGDAEIGTYSRGMRQRLGIARALVNDPVVVFLDEPTLGLDPRGEVELLALVRRIASERSAGVIFCSHLLTEVEELCDDVVILREGQIVTAGTVRDVVEQSNRNMIRIRSLGEHIPAARQILTGLPGIAAVSANGGKSDILEMHIESRIVRNSPEDAQLKNHILSSLLQAGVPVLNFDADSGSRLQDIFFQLTEEPRS
jgi:ABC-2 type transport system ATP-binding protein